MGNTGSAPQTQPLPAPPSTSSPQRTMLQVPLTSQPSSPGATSSGTTQQAAAAAATTAQQQLPPQQATQRFQATDSANNRISVDIRGSQLGDAEWQVHVKRQDPEVGRLSRVENSLRGMSTTIQSVAGAVISVLMVAKLVEEIMFVRKLRKELNSITAAISDPRPGGLEQGQPSQARPGSGPKSGPAGALDLVSMAGLATAGTVSTTATDAVTWDKVAGLHEVKMLLQEVTVLPTLRPDLFTGIRQPPRGVLLFGPPGSGKTLLARAVATESRSTFIPVTGSSILSMWFGQSEQNVKALFERARRCQPAVIFIDEVDSLLGRRGGTGAGGGPSAGSDSMPDKRVTNEFLSFIDGIQTSQLGDCRITLMAATNTPWDLDEAALSRFSRRIYVPLPDKNTRAQLVRQALQGVACDLQEEQYAQLAERVGQYSGRDLVAVCREAAMQPVRELWGNRLLAGGEEGERLAAQQRLVLVVAEQLRRGGQGQAKRIRRELEAYRKKLERDTGAQGGNSNSSGTDGAAASVAWLNVDDVMLRAEHMVAAKTSTRATAAAVTTAAAATLQLPSATQQLASATATAAAAKGVDTGPGACAAGDAASAVSSATVAVVASCSQGQFQASMPKADETASDVAEGSGVVSCADDEHHKAVRALDGGAVQAESDQGRGEVGHGTCNDSASAAQSTVSSGVESGGSVTTSGRPSVTGEGELQAASVSDPRQEAEQAAQAKSFSDGREPTSGEAGTSHSSAVCAASRETRAGGKTARPGSKSKAVAATAGSEAGALSMQALLSLPSDQLRPVCFADFERALSLISPADFEGATVRFEEWNSQYGSGADAKGRDARHNRAYFSMYV